MKQIILSLLFALVLPASAQNFDEYFEDNTLRLDYVFGGDSTSQYIQLSQLYKQPRWAGRKARLAEDLSAEPDPHDFRRQGLSAFFTLYSPPARGGLSEGLGGGSAHLPHRQHHHLQ